MLSCKSDFTKDGELYADKIKSESESHWAGWPPWEFKHTYYDTYHGKPYTGKVIKFYPDGKIEFTGSYVDGVKSYFWKYYFSNGQLRKVIWLGSPYEMKNGEYNKTYTENGTLTYQLISVDSLPYIEEKKTSKGITYYYNVDTLLIEKDSTTLQVLRIEHHALDKSFLGHVYSRSGDWLYYYNNGQLKEKATFRDNDLVGQYRFYYPDGTIKQKGMYKDGEEEGMWYEYHENGKKALEGMYRKGKHSGIWTSYDENGIWVKKTKYDDRGMEIN